MSKTLESVTAGSTLDLQFSFNKFGQEVIPSEASWKLIKQSSNDASSWELITSAEIEDITSSTFNVSIPGDFLEIETGYTLNRMLILEWTHENMPYKETLSFSLQTLPVIGG